MCAQIFQLVYCMNYTKSRYSCVVKDARGIDVRECSFILFELALIDLVQSSLCLRCKALYHDVAVSETVAPT